MINLDKNDNHPKLIEISYIPEQVPYNLSQCWFQGSTKVPTNITTYKLGFKTVTKLKPLLIK